MARMLITQGPAGALESNFYSKVLHCRIDQSFAAVKALFANFKVSSQAKERLAKAIHTVAHTVWCTAKALQGVRKFFES